MNSKWIVYAFLVLVYACGNSTSKPPLNQTPSHNHYTPINHVRTHDSVLTWVRIDDDIRIKDYFKFMDNMVEQVDTFEQWHLNEYIIVHANPWIIDSLRSFDYYTSMEKGVFIYDQSQLVIFHKGDSIAIPDSAYASHIAYKLSTTIIDVNIPEFKLSLYQLNDTIFTCPVRAGRDAEKFIYVVGHTVNLRTPIGTGEIKWIDRMHKTINLDTGKEYPGTNRDDGKFTKMPIIPWIEPSINGIRYGVMIHPTTNPSTLGKAYSHGCIGTKEADAWTIYYNCPKGTKVIFRYDLQVINEKGDTIQLEDVYHLKK